MYCPDFFCRPVLLGQIAILPGTVMRVVQISIRGLPSVDVRLWTQGPEGVLTPTSRGFTLTGSELCEFAQIMNTAVQQAFEDAKFVDLGDCEPEPSETGNLKM